MLKRKYVIQKTFRIDESLAEDIEILAKILDRTQNDLVNIALRNLILENKTWFYKNILIDECSDYFYNGNDVEIEVENIYIKIKQNDNNVTLIFKNKDDNEEIIDENVVNLEDSYEVEKKLREYSIYLDSNSETVKKYLENRLNYD